MEVKFEINEDFLLESILTREFKARSSGRDVPEGIVALSQKAQNYEGYRFLIPAIPSQWINIPLDNLDAVKENFTRLSNFNPNGPYSLSRNGGSESVVEFAREIKKTKEYESVLQSTGHYKEELKAQWELHYSDSLAIMQDITGIDFQHDLFVVYVSHQLYQNGHYLGQKRIGFGTEETYPHSLVIDLWHEILHDRIPLDGRTHVTIQFVADNELRVRLNKEAKQYPPFIGYDPELFGFMELLLPAWQEYLATPNRNILDFHKKRYMKS